MNVTKFRAWHLRKKFMVSPDNGNCSFEWLGDRSWQVVDHEAFIHDGDEFILMQFTGRLDKNGKEIYEGDIVRVTGETKDQFGINEVIYEPDFCRFSILQWNKNAGIADADCFLRGFDPEPTNVIEVLGNIYENPELIKKSN